MHQVWTGVLNFISGNWTEILGFVTGAVCVWLLVKENIWTWPTGIANNIFYIFIFLHSGLYADMGLQFVYIAIAIYGWWNWLHGGNNHSTLTVNHASVAGICGYLGLTAAATAVLYWLLRQFTPSTVPFADGLTTALFLTAQYMMSRKLVQNWWFWITGDVLVIGLYTYKHLYLTSVLYAVFLVMCILGLVEWQRATRKRARRQRVLSNFDASPFVKQRARRPGHQPLVISTDDEGAVATEAEWRDPDKVFLPCRVKAFSRFREFSSYHLHLKFRRQRNF